MFCEKCGNKIKEEYAFCDKCGAKVSAKVEKKDHKEEKKEKIEEERPVPPVPPERPPRPPKQKSGKGMLVFLWIMVVILLATTITFLILWLTKSTENSNTSNYNGEKPVVTPTPTPKPAKTESYIGKWEQNVEYKSGTEVVQRTYGLIELKEDGTFRSLFYDKDDISGTKEEIEGSYKVNNDVVTFKYTSSGVSDTLDLTIKDGKLCLNIACDDYLVKDSYNNKITIYDDDDDDDDNINEIETITYDEYVKLQKDYKDAIVVVVKPGCAWCEKFESVVEKINDYYAIHVYYYNSDGKISITGTPTTIVIKNGYIVDTIEGYKEFSDMETILDDLGVK